MGQTQLLLVVLAVILVGVAIFVGVSMFTANAIENTRNAIITDLHAFSAKALAYYWKPATQGGGNRSFTGVTIGRIAAMGENPNARYYVESAQDDNCVIVGVGKIVTSEGDSILVRVQVSPTKRAIVEIVH
jgi:hypothetical protein